MLFLAQKEGFEPSRAFYTPTPLAGEPLRPLGYFCMPNVLCNIKLPNHISTVLRQCQGKGPISVEALSMLVYNMKNYLNGSGRYIGHER